MSQFRWNSLKNKRLQKTRGVSFEELLEGELIRIIDHPARVNQKIILIWYREYVWAVPYVEIENEIFLKTFYPCRKFTKMFKKGKLK